MDPGSTLTVHQSTLTAHQSVIHNMSTNVKPFEDGKTANGADSGQVPDGDTIEGHVTTHDAVFGEITENGPNYRNVSDTYAA